jgi:hypothetical protein
MSHLKRWTIGALLLTLLLSMSTQPAAAEHIGVGFNMDQRGGITVTACGEAKSWWIEMKELQPNPRYIGIWTHGPFAGCVTTPQPVIWLAHRDVVQLAVGSGEYSYSMPDGSIYNTRYYQATRTGRMIDVQFLRETPDLPPQPDIRQVWFRWSDQYNGSIIVGYDMTCYTSHGLESYEDFPTQHPLGQWSWGPLQGTSERFGATGVNPDLQQAGASRC